MPVNQKVYDGMVELLNLKPKAEPAEDTLLPLEALTRQAKPEPAGGGVVDITEQYVGRAIIITGAKLPEE